MSSSVFMEDYIDLSQGLVFSNGKRVRLAALTKVGLSRIEQSNFRSESIANQESTVYAVDQLLKDGYELIGTL